MAPVDFGIAVGKIVWINILLSGDNAVVIALACRSLTGRERQVGIALGAAGAVLFRIIGTVIVAELMSIPYLRAAGALLLLWIAVKLVLPQDEDPQHVHGHDNLWRAVFTVIVADLVMSLDNVLAIAAAANGSQLLIVLGLALSVPLVVLGSSAIMQVMNRLPLLVWGGAALLGWIAGGLLAEDTAARLYLPEWANEYVLGAIGTLLVVGLGALITRRKATPASGE
ncbi:TerC family protein [soil metagenome]